MTSTKASAPSDPSRPSSNSASLTANQTPTSTSTSNTKPRSGPQSHQYPGLGANFAHDPKAPFAVSYDEEVYLQLIGDDAAADGAAGTGTGTASTNGAKKHKTPTQIYREEWVRRALNPAISDPRGEPSSNDFECAESRRVSDRL